MRAVCGDARVNTIATKDTTSVSAGVTTASFSMSVEISAQPGSHENNRVGIQDVQ